MIIQFCGLSGSGKTTLAQKVKAHYLESGTLLEVLDGDEYRRTLCADLGFSPQDRQTNMRRLAFVAGKLAQYGIISLISAINPYEKIRREIKASFPQVFTIYIKCSLEELIRRDPKQLYARAFLPEGHPEKMCNLSGVNDAFDEPADPDLVLETDKETAEACCRKLIRFIEEHRKK